MYPTSFHSFFHSWNLVSSYTSLIAVEKRRETIDGELYLNIICFLLIFSRITVDVVQNAFIARQQKSEEEQDKAKKPVSSGNHFLTL